MRRLSYRLSYTDLAAEMQGRFFEVLLPSIERLGWDTERLTAHRRDAMRKTLSFAAERSRWHAERLAGIDLDALDPEDLGALPVMTKRDLMANWDAVVTDPRLDLRSARAHLDRLDTGPEFLLEEYHVLTTGGSTGEPGVFCWSREELIAWLASGPRWALAAGVPPAQRPAFVGARSLRHPSAALGVLLAAMVGGDDLLVPVDQPAELVVARLNELQPDALIALSSILPVLVAAARERSLKIDVRQITVGGDQLDRDDAAAAAEAFGATVLETYPTTDVGYIANQTAGEHGMYLNEDLLIVEAVDAHDRPAGAGEDSDHVLVTSLHQRTLPLIRYRIDDRVRIDPTSGRHGAYRKIAAIEGRTDDLFIYDTATVHPHVFRAVFARHPTIWDYRVTQTARGADVALAAEGGVDTSVVEADLVKALHRAGLPDAEVRTSAHGELTRTGMGKRIRFVPRR